MKMNKTAWAVVAGIVIVWLMRSEGADSLRSGIGDGFLWLKGDR